jgi:putative two-component system response regulator
MAYLRGDPTKRGRKNGRPKGAGGAMKRTILVVEDDAVAREYAGGILEPHYEVAYANDAQEARGKLIGGPIDLLLCDIFLPGENGMDLVETVLGWEAQIAAVLITGADDPSLVERAFEMGVYGYLLKPYRGGDLLITVTNALRRRQLEIQARDHERELERDLITQSLETERVRQRLRQSEERLERSRLETVQKLSLAVEMRDQVTGHHLRRKDRRA